MRTPSKWLQHLVVICMIALNSFAFARAIKYESFSGILLALAAFTTIFYVIALFRRIRKLEESGEAEEQLLD